MYLDVYVSETPQSLLRVSPFLGSTCRRCFPALSPVPSSKFELIFPYSQIRFWNICHLCVYLFRTLGLLFVLNEPPAKARISYKILFQYGFCHLKGKRRKNDFSVILGEGELCIPHYMPELGFACAGSLL